MFRHFAAVTKQVITENSHFSECGRERSSTEWGPLESGPRVWVVVVFYSVPTDGRGTEWFCNRRGHSPIKRTGQDLLRLLNLTVAD